MDDLQLQQLLRKVSHDLSAPARSAVGFSKILLETNESLDPQARKWLELIKGEGLYAQNALSRLSQYAKLFGDEKALVECDLNQSVKQAMTHSVLVSEAISSNKLLVDCEQLPIVSGVSSLWQMLFAELLENSIVHNAQAELVRCKVSVGHQQLCFSDDGVGIKQEFFQKARQPLVALTGARTTGFGLAICDEIIRIFHGSLELRQSDEGGLLVILGMVVQ